MLGQMLTQRPASSMADLEDAVALTSAAWRAGSPAVASTPAGIEWWHALSHPDPISDHLRLWHLADATGTPRLVAWTWHEPPEIEWHVWTGNATADASVVREVFGTLVAAANYADFGVFASDDDGAAQRALGDLGFAASGRRLSQWLWRAADGPAPRPAATPTLPTGYRIRGLTGPAEIEARVAVHRAAFPTSRLTAARYERLLDMPHYRLEDDLVVEASDGSFAAFALTWWDPIGRVGEFEPLGTHPDHRRRGLARALLTAGIERSVARGARAIEVFSDAADAPAEALYPAAGFVRRNVHRRYARPPSAASGATIDG
jgi:ribosomal protein S18 acetylase RimI-like enzyme